MPKIASWCADSHLCQSSQQWSHRAASQTWSMLLCSSVILELGNPPVSVTVFVLETRGCRLVTPVVIVKSAAAPACAVWLLPPGRSTKWLTERKSLVLHCTSCLLGKTNTCRGRGEKTKTAEGWWLNRDREECSCAFSLLLWCRLINTTGSEPLTTDAQQENRIIAKVSGYNFSVLLVKLGKCI